MKTSLRSLGWIMLVTLALPVSAHRPQTFDADEIITDPLISWTLPGTFETGREVYSLSLIHI